MEHTYIRQTSYIAEIADKNLTKEGVAWVTLFMNPSESKSRLINVLAALSHLYECRDVGQLPYALQRVFMNTIKCNIVVWYDIGEDMKIRRLDPLYDELALEFPYFLSDLQQLFDESPLATYLADCKSKCPNWNAKSLMPE